MIHITKCVRGFVCVACLIGLVNVTHVGVSGAAEPRAGAWSGNAAIGVLGNTPDGTAFATNVHADYFLNHQISVGPLTQLAVTGDLFQFGLSGQGKYWFDLPGLDKRLKMNLQGGARLSACRPLQIQYLLSDPDQRGPGLCAEPASESHIHLLAQLHRCRYWTWNGRQRDAGTDVRRSILTPLAGAVGAIPIVRTILFHFTNSSLCLRSCHVTPWR